MDQNHHYLMQKSGVFYFSRRVPSNLQHHFQRQRFVRCLHTRSELKAHRLSQELSSRLENIWDRQRLELINFAPTAANIDYRLMADKTAAAFTISDAFAMYLRLKSINRPATFETNTRRNLRYLTDCLGDVDICALLPQHGGQFRDYLIARGLATSSIKRIFSTVKAVLNLAKSELGLTVNNPFSTTFIPQVGVVKSRSSIADVDIERIQTLCRKFDDDQRWLIALISDTGLRLAEAAGLLVSDINLHCPIPYVDIKPHPWRRLKTISSARQVPLIGASLWAAQRICETADGAYAFSRYCSEERTKANSASGALNKWLHTHIGNQSVIHSFRHSFRDRLRAVECPSDISDALGGWSAKGIGQRYGEGYKLNIKHQWISKIERLRSLD